jgi:hypothetical protein
MSDQKIVVLGAAVGYSAAQLWPFFASIRQSIPDANVVLFREGRVFSSSGSVVCVTPSDLWLRRLIRQMPRGQRIASRFSFEIGKIFCRVKAKGICPSLLIPAAFGVALARYFWYLNWLKSGQASGYTHVVLSDTRDVIFQGNPFSNDFGADRMFCGEEPAKISGCPINSRWYRDAFGEIQFERIADQRILCSGVTGGPVDEIVAYLEQMCQRFMEVGSRILWNNGFDQAVHNELLRFGSLSEKVRIERSDGARLATMHHMSPDAVVVGADQRLRNAEGAIIAIVHQYDRHSALRSVIQSVYGPPPCQNSGSARNEVRDPNEANETARDLHGRT